MVNKTAFWGRDRLPQKCEMCKIATSKQGARTENIGSQYSLSQLKDAKEGKEVDLI